MTSAADDSLANIELDPKLEGQDKPKIVDEATLEKEDDKHEVMPVATKVEVKES